MPRFLLLRLEGPLLAFGGEVVDARGVIVDFPGRSMLTGLFANALGWNRSEREKLARLQERLVFAARIDRQGERIADFQTAALGGGDKGWTTRGRPEGRAGGAGTYLSPHIRRRDYDCDAAITVAACLLPSDEDPDLDALETALDRPARPLFLGRKPCLPTHPIRLGLCEAPDLTRAITAAPLADEAAASKLRLLLPETERSEPHDTLRIITDERNWRSGVHGGGRQVRLRTVPRTACGPEGQP